MKYGMLEILRDLVVTDTSKIKPLRAVYGNIDDDKGLVWVPAKQSVLV
jgi:hypothetical protein